MINEPQPHCEALPFTRHCFNAHRFDSTNPSQFENHLDETSAIDFLFSRINYERKKSLPYNEKRMNLRSIDQLLGKIGAPHRQLNTIHVAGTKGKGSTSLMISEILQESGFSVGIYTSPHLEHVRERFVVNGSPVNPDAFVKAFTKVKVAIDELDALHQTDPANYSEPTFFEITTALAFQHFADQQVDFVVLETGLGGRLDSTNICEPILCVITSISHDHMKQLGETLPEIAGEKAGIIKKNIPIISGVDAADARRVIEKKANKENAPFFQLGEQFSINNLRTEPQANSIFPRSSFDLNIAGEPSDSEFFMPSILVAMAGNHQAKNAAVSAFATILLKRQILAESDEKKTIGSRIQSRDAMISVAAIKAAIGKAQLAGRIEVLGTAPPIIFDVAHNDASIKALLQTLDAAKSLHWDKSTLIFATSRDKDWKAMLKLLLPKFQKVVFTQFLDNPRATDPKQLLSFAKRTTKSNQSVRQQRLESAATPEKALIKAQDLAEKDGFIAVCGSTFIVAQVRKLC